MESYQQLFSAAILAGEITLESGAEIFRVEDTTRRILSLTGFETVEVFATTTGLFVTLADPSIQPVTQVRRITSRATNLNRIALVNEISRELCTGKLQPGDAIDRLHEIRNAPPYSPVIISLGLTLSTMGFAVLFGGGIPEIATAGLACAAMELTGFVLRRRIASGFIDNAVKSLIIAFVANLAARLFPLLQVETVIISSIMPLVPGVPITNGIRDTLQGDYTAGLARSAEAFVCALAIAVGSLAGTYLCRLCTELL